MRHGLFIGVVASLIASTVTAEEAKPATPAPPAVADTSLADKAAVAALKAAEAAQAAADVAKAAGEALKKDAPAPPPPPPPPAPVVSPWAGALSFDLIYMAGNTSQLMGAVSGGLDYKTENWIFGGKASGKYGQSKALHDATDQVLAQQAALAFRVDRRFATRYSGFVAVGGETDHVKSVEWRGSGEAGISIAWWDEKDGDLQKALFRSDIGLRGSRESRFQYFPELKQIEDVDLLAPRVGYAFRYALNKNVLFVSDGEVIVNVLGQSRQLANFTAKIQAALTTALSAQFGYQLAYDSAPAAGRIPSDSVVTLGVALKL